MSEAAQAASEAVQAGSKKTRRKTEYFVIASAQRFSSKSEVEKYVNQQGLAEGALIVKGTAVETRKVESVKLS